VQGMGFIVAVLLIFMSAEETFWSLAALVECVLPAAYLSKSLLGLRAEIGTFEDMLAETLPRLFSHLQAHGIYVQFFATRWFLSLFTTSLPIETVLRVWDVLACEGIKVVHRIGIALLRLSEAELLTATDQSAMLLLLQQQEARCLDAERLLALAFDTRAFRSPFRRANLAVLRAKHRARFEAEIGEGASSPASAHRAGVHACDACAPGERVACAHRVDDAVRSSSRSVPPVASSAEDVYSSSASFSDESSSDDTEDLGSEVPFEILSHDDCAITSPR